MAPRPQADDAEAVAKQELEQNLQRLDAHDVERGRLQVRVDASLKDLARARGVGFIRLPAFRDELRREKP